MWPYRQMKTGVSQPVKQKEAGTSCFSLPLTAVPPADTLRRKLVLWPAQAQEWAGQHAAYAHCGDVWTLPHRSHPSHAGEGSGSGEWCRGSPKGCGFPDLGFLSSEAAHTASPATVGSAQVIHWAPRNQMWVERQLDLKLCAASFAGLISHRTPPTLSRLLVSTNPWYVSCKLEKQTQPAVLNRNQEAQHLAPEHV